MKVYALVGKSGTGKSYQAMNLCREKDIESIIDDGLYIYKTEAMGGMSAKREPTKVGAIKTALFSKDDHRDEVTKLIEDTNPQSILLLGTSDGMVRRFKSAWSFRKSKAPSTLRTLPLRESGTSPRNRGWFTESMWYRLLRFN